ncbi:MAG: hypothetical protein HY080_08045 [Gammaproteobacteria bacterium]|nr:hypothetical protein [Gammaproteobacteria bacterium]
MKFFDISLIALLGSLVIVGILFVVFGEYTVRRLRKKPELKDILGFEYVNGKDIINVGMALSFPRKLMRKARQSKLSFMFADADILYQHTSRVDRWLARIFTYSYFFTAFGLLIIVILHNFKLI